MDPSARVAEGAPNLPTRIHSGVAAPVDLGHAYGFARGLVGLEADARPAGHRLVWVRGAAYASTLLDAGESSFAILGRHTSCSVQLADDPHVALRHLLVRSLALPSGSVLAITDLHTDAGFRLADGSRHTSVLAEGPVVFSVGEYAVVALPAGRDSACPGELPPPRITTMPMPAFVGDAMPPSVSRLAGGTYALTLARDGHEATVSITEDELVRGVLIGRSEKCHSERLRRVTESGTSRVHVLVVREGSAIHAYDLASTQGTYIGASRVRRARLPAQGSAMLILGHTPSAVRLAWRAG